MPLIENTLFGIHNKIEIAILRIKEFEPMALMNNSAGYYVCVSGGKDSSVIQELCIMAGVKCEFVHNLTSVDHPQTIYFIRREQERLKAMGHIFNIEIPRDHNGKQKTMWNGIVKKGLPTPWARWCCSELKETGGIGRYCITGVRWSESIKRRKRGLHEENTPKKDNAIILNNDNDMRRHLSETCIPKRKFILNPIIDWIDDEVWEFLKMRKVPVNPLYSLGYKRVGCVGCIMSKRSKKELYEYLRFKNAYFRAVEKHFEYRIKRGLKMDGHMESPESYFEWWLNG